MTLDPVVYTAVNALLSNALFSAAGLALLHFVWQGALLALGLALLLRALRSERAGLRYALACGTLLLMAVTPLATFGGLYGGSNPATSPKTGLEPLLISETADEARSDEAATPSTALTPVSPVASTGEAARPLKLFYAPFASLNVGRVAPFVTLLWGLGVLFLALRLLGGVWVSARLGRKGRLAPVHYQQRLLELSRCLGLKKPVRLLESRAVAVPVVAGLLKPVILLPTSALTGLSPLQLEMILAHELAHVRRRDPLVNGLQHLVETALFYHPAVWWVSSVVREEREACCDAVATRLCGDPLAYAETLARLERLRGPGPLVLAASGGRLKTRIERLLGLRRTPTGSPLVTFGLALGLVGVLGVAGVLAQSGGTADTPPTLRSASGLEVVLDAGHGGAFRGASGYAVEDEVALAAAEKVAARLEAAGVRVIMTREGDAALGNTSEEDLNARLARVTPDTDAFVSLHANASDDPLTQGIETFVARKFGTGELEAATLALAEGLQAGLAGVGASNRGVKRSPYNLLEQASVPAVIIELGFVTNPEEGAKLATEAYQDTLAEAISRAVLTFLQADAQPDVQSPEVRPLYEEARAYCTGEKSAESGFFDTSFTMLTVQPDADKEFFIKPGFDELVQTCVRRFVADPDFRERLKNPSERDFLLGR